MSPFPRLRQSCRKDHRVSAGALQGQDPRLVLNRLFLSGVLVADPQSDQGRDGEPVTLLLVAFPAPDARNTEERLEVASCEVEVPEHVAGHQTAGLRAGGSVFITGQLNGGGGVIATEIHAGLAPDSAA